MQRKIAAIRVKVALFAARRSHQAICKALTLPEKGAIVSWNHLLLVIREQRWKHLYHHRGRHAPLRGFFGTAIPDCPVEIYTAVRCRKRCNSLGAQSGNHACQYITASTLYQAGIPGLIVGGFPPRDTVFGGISAVSRMHYQGVMPFQH